MITKILAWLSGVGSSLLAFLQPIVATESGKLLNALLPIALSVVTEIAQTHDLPNVKRDAAYAKLKDAAESYGIAVSNSVLNAAIELAYQHFRATEPQTIADHKPGA